MPAPRVDYYTYIQSPEWRARATAAKQRASYRCQVCNRPSSQVTLDAHHRTYARLGNERDDDITVLCRDCHELYEFSKRLPKPPPRTYEHNADRPPSPPPQAFGTKYAAIIFLVLLGVVFLAMSGIFRPSATPSTSALRANPPTARASRAAPVTSVPSPLPTPTPPSAISLRVIAVRNVNLRSGPGTEYAIVGSIAPGSYVDVIATNAALDWLLLTSSAWAHAPLIEPTADLPIATPSPGNSALLPATATPVAVPSLTPTPTPIPAALPTVTRPATSRSPVASALSMPLVASLNQATVLRVIDGDTIEVSLGGTTYRLRYIGMDTPERFRPYYDEATAANRSLVANQTVYLEKDVSETDRYGRLLRYVWLADGTLVNHELVRRGYAQVATFPPDVKYESHFRAAQRAAIDEERGLWESPISVGLLPAPSVSGPVANTDANLRAGPGTVYPRVDGVIAGQSLEIVGRNTDSTWYVLASGAWISAGLVNIAPSTLSIVAAPPIPTPIPALPTPTLTSQPAAVCPCTGDLYNCPDFPTQSAAQACFNYCRSLGRGDIHRLDGNNDGLACELLP